MTILDSLEAAEAKATKGPWKASGRRITEMTHRSAIAHTSDFYSNDGDAILIALLRNHAADLIAATRLLQRIRLWDIVAGPGLPRGEFTADAPYWRGEIDAVLAPLTTEGSE